MTQAVFTREAKFSDDRAYRYRLVITWDASLPTIAFGMLNPSIADELRNDPTVERCVRRGIAMGFGRAIIFNLYALVSTDPKELRRHMYPVGDLNDEFILQAVNESKMVILAWGTLGTHMSRNKQVLKLLEPYSEKLFHLGLSADGHPKHPLYIAYDVAPKRFLPVGV